ncbi:MAG: alpha/beta fold hydrolase [Saprospiraceae bacterium]
MSNKTPILLLHGALGNVKQFSKIADILSEKMEVKTLNFRGHDRDVYDGPFSMKLFVQDIKQFIEESKIGKIHIFGYSMGGYAGMCYARLFPDKVSKIMTLGTKFKWTEDIAKKEVLFLNPEVIESKLPQYVEVLKRRFDPNDWKSIMQRTADMMIDLGKDPPLKDNQYKYIKNQTLICLGDEDHMVSKEESKYVADSLLKGKFQLYDGWKHSIDSIDSRELASYILDYFTTNTYTE